MSQSNENDITALAEASFRDSPDARFAEVMQTLVRHLHAFVRETGLTGEEWMTGIDFLTRTGQICTSERQEFILLSDTLGVSTLVDGLNYAALEEATESTVLGPFYVETAPEVRRGADISGAQAGSQLYIEGAVHDDAGKPVAGAVVDVWQADAEGFYDVQKAHRETYHLRGRVTTDARGRFSLWSIVPALYPIPYDGPVGGMLAKASRHPYRPAHVHFMIAAPGYQRLVTQIFDASSDYLDDDTVFGVKASLIEQFETCVGPAPDDSLPDGPWQKLSRTFQLMPARQAERDGSRP